MSLTFTDWNACTDTVSGQAFALNWTADTGMLPYVHLEAIRQAIAERYAAAGLTLTGVLASPLVYGTTGTRAISAAIDAAITALIPAYVNHTDNGGNWDGLATCAPAWTAADILTAISAASRLTAGTTGKPLSVAWAKQVYALLGMMRWVKSFAADVDSREYRYIDITAGYLESESSVWSRAVAEWALSTWVAGSGSPDSEAYALRNADSGSLHISRVRSKYTISPASVTTNADIYVFPDPGYGLIGHWNNQGDWDDTYNQKYNLFQSFTGITSTVYSNYIGNNNSIPVYPFGEIGSYGWRIYVSAIPSTPQSVIIRKYNVSGGFTFQ